MTNFNFFFFHFFPINHPHFPQVLPKRPFFAFLGVYSIWPKTVQNGQQMSFLKVFKNRHQKLSNPLHRADFWQKLAEIRHFQFWPFFEILEKSIFWPFLAWKNQRKWPKWQKNRFSKNLIFWTYLVWPKFIQNGEKIIFFQKNYKVDTKIFQMPFIWLIFDRNSLRYVIFNFGYFVRFSKKIRFFAILDTSKKRDEKPKIKTLEPKTQKEPKTKTFFLLTCPFDIPSTKKTKKHVKCFQTP